MCVQASPAIVHPLSREAIRTDAAVRPFGLLPLEQTLLSDSEAVGMQTSIRVCF